MAVLNNTIFMLLILNIPWFAIWIQLFLFFLIKSYNICHHLTPDILVTIVVAVRFIQTFLSVVFILIFDVFALLFWYDVPVLFCDELVVVHASVEQQIRLLIKGCWLFYFAYMGVVHFEPIVAYFHERIVVAAIWAASSMDDHTVKLQFVMFFVALLIGKFAQI